MLRNLILTLTASIAATSLTLWLVTQPDRQNTLTAPPPPPVTIEQVQSLRTLVTTRLIGRSECTKRIEGYLGGLSVTWQGSGSVLLRPDLSRAKIIDRNDAARTATILLPEPTALEQTLCLSTGRLSTEFEGLWQLAPDERLAAVEQGRTLARAQSLLEHSVTVEQLAVARDSAQTSVQTFGRSIGWTVQPKWQPHPARPPLPNRRSGSRAGRFV